MAASDVTLPQNGGLGAVKVHPYVVTLVRWCVSCVWSAATVLLHRLLAAPSLPIASIKPQTLPRAPPRPASYDHLHPEPLVECVVLHQPEGQPEVDFIFVHGLYGSLENTWRQGEWRNKYKIGPNLMPLLRPTSKPTPCEKSQTDISNVKQTVLPHDEEFITEKFYNESVMNRDNYEKQYEFVQDLFNSKVYEDTKVVEEKSSVCVCKNTDKKFCVEGCGCVCDLCYSPCWPRDWLKVDFPGCRVISINYTSDPYLWRPLWIKECKRLRLHERAEQMSQQLLSLGVGQRPIVWVGHSKGGLFIKQIYCEAYESYKRKSEKENGGSNMADYNENFTEDTPILTTSEIDAKNNNRQSNELLNAASNVICCDENRSNLWSKSAGFMFYSVPHRGSPLADIKTPLTARSVELLEICKDNDLVLTLQERWLNATEPTKPLVRSLVETNRTLMSVLWLKIVSVESADAGIGALCGISVDHREICKPSSRTCILYNELTNLIKSSLAKWCCDIKNIV